MVQTAPPDVPSVDRPVPPRTVAPPGVRAPLPRHGRGLPRRRPPFRRGPHRAGSEVGGGDERVTLGTVASIERAAPRNDGRWHLVVAGTGLLRVTRWLADDPYPRALVEPCGGVPATDGDAMVTHRSSSGASGHWCRSSSQARAPPDVAALDDDPDVALWQLCALAPVRSWIASTSSSTRARRTAGAAPRARPAVGDDIRRIFAGG